MNIETEESLSALIQELLNEASSIGRAYWCAVDAGSSDAVMLKADMLKIEWIRVSRAHREAVRRLAAMVTRRESK